MGQATNLWQPEVIADGGSSFLDKAREHTLQQFHTQVWRECRREYRKAAAEVRAEIKATWKQWSGQKTSTALRYLVDCCTGAYSKRLREIRDAENREAAMVHFGLSALIAPQLKVR